ncbi:MAG TPA: signal peptidase I [Dehalococcoidia bacterium]|nr:signal peptidase I [Dehalococcoidia bacterium]
MITETARPETQAGGRRRRWIRGAGRLASALASLGVLGLLGLLLATAAAPRIWGYQTYVIYGSSMEPTIKLGSLVVAEPANVDDLQVGDIIVFRSPSNGTTVTHRIVGIREEDDQRYFQTKGDASNGGDPLEVSLENGVQQVAYDLPYLGYFVDFANSTLGIVLLLVLPALGLLGLHWTKSREAAATDREAAGEG